jgi:hypothetical protein
MDVNGRIEGEVGSWEGVTVHPHRFGGIEFRLGRRELGHLHFGRPDGGALADLPFRRSIRDMLVETGRAQAHRILPDSGWISKPIRGGKVGDGDIADAIELFRLSYERARVAQAARAARLGQGSGD